MGESLNHLYQTAELGRPGWLLKKLPHYRASVRPIDHPTRFLADREPRESRLAWEMTKIRNGQFPADRYDRNNTLAWLRDPMDRRESRYEIRYRDAFTSPP